MIRTLGSISFLIARALDREMKLHLIPMINLVPATDDIAKIGAKQWAQTNRGSEIGVWPMTPNLVTCEINEVRWESGKRKYTVEFGVLNVVLVFKHLK